MVSFPIRILPYGVSYLEVGWLVSWLVIRTIRIPWTKDRLDTGHHMHTHAHNSLPQATCSPVVCGRCRRIEHGLFVILDKEIS
jgi:hypothetical protein